MAMTLAGAGLAGSAVVVDGFGWGGPPGDRAESAEELTVAVRQVPLPHARRPGLCLVMPAVLATVVHVWGDLDVVTVPLLRTRLETLLSPGVQLVLDVTDVGYADPAGLGVLEATRARARARGGEVHLVAAPGGVVARLFRLTGWSFGWPLYPDLDAVLRAAHAGWGA